MDEASRPAMPHGKIGILYEQAIKPVHIGYPL